MARIATFAQGLGELGWTIGRNVQIEYRSVGRDADSIRRNAAELVAVAPDVILASGAAATAALQRVSRTVPIVFASTVDPVGAGLVATMARPDGNATGFMIYEYGLSAKWLELLKQIAPRVNRVAVLRNPSNAAGIGQLAAIQAVAPTFGVELTPLRYSDEIERTVAAFARAPNGGMIVTPGATTHRALIIALAARHALPSVYPYRYFVAGGGLISYGPDTIDSFRRAAGYVDRILRGEKPAELPVQAPTKYELVINLKSAKALGLDIPATVYARADEVIE